MGFYFSVVVVVVVVITIILVLNLLVEKIFITRQERRNSNTLLKFCKEKRIKRKREIER